MPKVSICVPVYNVEQYISRCVESLQNQTMSDIEIIVVNDCTPDKSMELVQTYAESDSRIRIISHDKNKGLMRARQTGYLVAKGEYVTFCDSDDSLPEDAIETLYVAAVKTNADIVSGDMTYINVDNIQTPVTFSLSYGNDKESVYRSLLAKEYGHNLCSKLFKRSLFANNTYKTFDNFINGEDGCLFYQVVANASKTVHLSRSVYNYYQNMNSSSNVRLKKTALESICILNSIRIETVKPYQSLISLLEVVVANVLCNLYYKGYNIDGFLDGIIDRYSLNYYKSFRCIMKIRPFSLMIKLMTKRYITRKSI